MRKLEIINLYKHNIVYKNIKNINIKSCLLSLLLCVVAIFSFCYLANVNNDVKSSISAFNPISELYRDIEVASFVSGASVNFIVPVKTEKYVVNFDNIEFEITSSIVIYSPANGVVEEIGNYNHNAKFIKIKHADNLFSIINNVDIVGVKVGDIVKQGKTLATAQCGDMIIFSIENDNKKVEGLYLTKNFIKWKQD